MAMTAQNQAYVATVSNRYRPFIAIKTFFQLFSKSVAASNEFKQLSTLSEKELAHKGLKRESISEYVITLYFGEV